MARSWTEADDATLRETYPKGQNSAAAALPRYAMSAIKFRAHTLGLRVEPSVMRANRVRSRPFGSNPWTDAEIQIIEDRYAEGRKVCEPLLPGRTWEAVVSYAKKRGLSQPRDPALAWTAEVDATLRSIWSRPIGEIVAQLGRTTKAIYKRASVLGLPRRIAPPSSTGKAKRPSGGARRAAALARGAVPAKPRPAKSRQVTDEDGAVHLVYHPEHFQAQGITRRACAWPMWAFGETPAQPLFCGEGAAGTHSYCPVHCVLAFRPSRDPAKAGEGVSA
jgi:hypothetical protein